MSQSLKEKFLALPRQKQEAFIQSTPEEELAALINSWEWEARPQQLEPLGDWFCWLVLAGRGFGKTRAASEFIISRVMNNPNERVALIGRTSADTRDVMIEGVSGILAIAKLRGIQAHYEPSKRRVTFGNGAIATAYSAEEPDLLRGPEHSLGWLDELASFSVGKEHGDAYSNFIMGLRLGKHPQFIASTTPRPTKLIRALSTNDSTVVTRGSTFDNKSNLPESFLQEISARYEGTRLGRQELYGQVLEEVLGALWTPQMFTHSEEPELADQRSASASNPKDCKDVERIVIAVDPATTVGENSDFTAITVASIYKDSFYIQHSEAIKATPKEWATRVASLFNEWGAALIVAERNQGGLMVENTLHTINPNLPIKTIHASKSKRNRAEPVVALYEQGRVFHVGDTTELEEQMCLFPTPAAENDDLVDSAVYALSELAGFHESSKKTKQTGDFFVF